MTVGKPRSARVLTLAFCLTALTVSGQTPQPTASRTSVPQLSRLGSALELLAGRVVRVDNGDTIAVKADGKVYLVKLQAIDAPDLGQPYFENSRRALAGLIYDKNVRVAISSAYSKDSVIGTVYRDGQDVGLSLVEQGLAWHFKRFAYQQTSSSRKSYTDAEKSAASSGIGLWVETNPIPPWIFRGETAPTPSKAVESQPAVPPASPPAGRKYILGPRGGCYYVSESGRKVYVQDKSLCGVSPPEVKP